MIQLRKLHLKPQTTTKCFFVKLGSSAIVIICFHKSYLAYQQLQAFLYFFVCFVTYVYGYVHIEHV